MKMKKTIKEVLEKYADLEINLSSETAREILASAIIAKMNEEFTKQNHEQQ